MTLLILTLPTLPFITFIRFHYIASRYRYAHSLKALLALARWWEFSIFLFDIGLPRRFISVTAWLLFSFGRKEGVYIASEETPHYFWYFTVPRCRFSSYRWRAGRLGATSVIFISDSRLRSYSHFAFSCQHDFHCTRRLIYCAICLLLTVTSASPPLSYHQWLQRSMSKASGAQAQRHVKFTSRRGAR